ncbi:MAG: hypothetical protein J6A75_10325 [Lachnospiraceae bacterium]|nr:hypothetical protein [Lachnospiraceae bacterium]
MKKRKQFLTWVLILTMFTGNVNIMSGMTVFAETISKSVSSDSEEEGSLVLHYDMSHEGSTRSVGSSE